MVQRRDIAISIILSIVTCGIYGIYWFIVLTDDIGRVSGEQQTSGGLAFILTLITCNIYGIYWAYKMGQNISIAKQNRGVVSTGTDMSLIYLILAIFGLQIVNYALMQNELNNMQ